jgi:hypothetical protein
MRCQQASVRAGPGCMLGLHGRPGARQVRPLQPSSLRGPHCPPAPAPQPRPAHLVDEVRVGDLVHRLVQEGAGHVAAQPALAVLHLLLGERHLQQLAVLVACGGRGWGRGGGAVRVERRGGCPEAGARHRGAPGLRPAGWRARWPRAAAAHPPTRSPSGARPGPQSSPWPRRAWRYPDLRGGGSAAPGSAAAPTAGAHRPAVPGCRLPAEVPGAWRAAGRQFGSVARAPL